MKKLFVFLSIFVLALLIACHEPASKQDSQSNQVIKIGSVLSLTGDGAEYGIPIQQSMQIALDEVNEKWKAQNKKLELVWEDGKCNPKDGATAGQKLISVDNVKIIIGGVCSGETLGFSSIAEQNKVVVLSPTASNPDITNAGDYIFRTYPSDAYSASVAADYSFNELNKKKAALISENTDYAQGLRKVFSASFTKLGGEVVADEKFNTQDTNLRTQVLKVKQSNPDVVYIAPQTGTTGVLILKQLKDGGVNAQIVTAEVLLNRDLIKNNGDLLNNLVGLEPAFDQSNTKAKNLFDKYKAKFNKEPPLPFFMASGYDDVYLIAESIEKNGLDSEKIKQHLYNIKDWDGAVGKLTIDNNGDPVLKFNVKQVKDGNIVVIK